jgi:hypothetical protein
MKYLKKLTIDFNMFIKKNFFNQEIEIDDLYVEGITTDKDIFNYNYFKAKFENKNIINDKILNKIKYFIDNNDPKTKKINNFSFYYSFITTEYIEYLNETKGIQLSEIKEYLVKSPKYALNYLIDNFNTISEKDLKNYEYIIFSDINYACKYASLVLKDIILEYEKKLNHIDIYSFEPNYYVKNVTINIINSQPSLNDKSKKFDEFYEKSLLFRKSLKFNISKDNYTFFKFDFWNKTFEDLIIRNPKLMGFYIEDNYFDVSGSKEKKDNFNFERLKDLKIRINKDPKLIQNFYTGNRRDALFLPSNKHVIDILMTDPVALIDYIYNNNLNFNLEKLEEKFPGYKKIIQKADISSIMMFFLYIIRPIFLKTKIEINYSRDRELYKQFKDYLYENYPETIKKIAEKRNDAIFFAEIIGSPFKEGESKIFENPMSTKKYLMFLKYTLEKSLVPDYDSYKFDLIGQEEDFDDYADFEGV